MSARYRAAYFAASNSERGFVSYYDELFCQTSSMRYVIKGGPGCGKSRLMWDMVRAGEAAGCTAQLFYCSSDPTSLDAVIFSRGEESVVTVLDGTAPHEVNLSVPGVRDQMIDLGVFWSRQALRSQQEIIEPLMKEKRTHYDAAYRYLAAAGLCEQNIADRILPMIDEDRLERIAERLESGGMVSETASARTKLVKRAKKNESERINSGQTVCTASIGMRGCVRLPTLMQQASRICLIEPYYGVQYRLMHRIWEKLTRNEQRIIVSKHPIFPDYPDGIYLPEQGVAFVTDILPDEHASIRGEVVRTISLRRTLDRERLRDDRMQMKQLCRLRETLIAEAEKELLAASVPHFALEEIYGAAMDFDKKEQYSRDVCADIFGTLD